MAMNLARARWTRSGWSGGGSPVELPFPSQLRLNSSFQNLLPEQLTNKRFIPGYLRRWKLLTRPRERTTGSEQNAAWF